jgi:hypothetical protein
MPEYFKNHPLCAGPAKLQTECRQEVLVQPRLVEWTCM